MSGTAKEAERAQKAGVDGESSNSGGHNTPKPPVQSTPKSEIERHPTDSIENTRQQLPDDSGQSQEADAAIAHAAKDAGSTGRANSDRLETERVLAGGEPN